MGDASLYRVPDKKDMITRQKQPNKTARRTDIKYVKLREERVWENGNSIDIRIL
jgi:hypothetical protein